MIGEKKGGEEMRVMLIKLLRILKEQRGNVMYNKTQCGITPRAFERPMTPILSMCPKDTGVS